jgi:hypothetical protein
MKLLDAGHSYLVDSYDGGASQKIDFMKREGELYPGNVGSHPGTNCQELIRVLIDRMKYLDKQIRYPGNTTMIARQRECLYIFEDRAAQRHGRWGMFQVGMGIQGLDKIEELIPCETCGHTFCGGHDGTKNSF